MKQIICIITAALLFSGCPGCSKNTETNPASPDELIEQIITYHGYNGSQADEQVKKLLADLRKTDKRQSRLVTEIMDYWDYANAEMPVNTDKLPDGLPDDNSLAITVLGFELNDDGSMQEELLGRLNVALTCAEQYPNAYVICTGGGTARLNPRVTEGDLMGEWMLAHGLDSNRLIVENRSLSTAENALFSNEILMRDYPQVHSIAIVSSGYHIPWGALLFEAAFLKTAAEKNTPEKHVISNASCEIENNIYLKSDILRWETSGLLQIFRKSADEA